MGFLGAGVERNCASLELMEDYTVEQHSNRPEAEYLRPPRSQGSAAAATGRGSRRVIAAAGAIACRRTAAHLCSKVEAARHQMSVAWTSLRIYLYLLTGNTGGAWM